MITIGLELEWADVDRWFKIPEELGQWSNADYSIVNSDGHANCPTGTSWRWGGEINTRPTETTREQSMIVHQLAMMLNPTINFKCNLHVHVRDGRFDVMIQDVEKLKLFARYLRDAERFVYHHVELLEEPRIEDFADVDAYKGAFRRFRRNCDSHQHSLSMSRWVEMVQAKTPEEFKNAHASPTSVGGRAWHIAKRPGMNMRSLWKHGTIEYRHFPGSADPEECESSARWCRLFTENATNYAFGDSYLVAEQIHELHGPWRFPKFQPYDHALQLGFERTKHQ